VALDGDAVLRGVVRREVRQEHRRRLRILGRAAGGIMLVVQDEE
jgi:hypothetical protein